MAISDEVRARVRLQAQNRCGYCHSLQDYILGILEIEQSIGNRRFGIGSLGRVGNKIFCH